MVATFVALLPLLGSFSPSAVVVVVAAEEAEAAAAKCSRQGEKAEMCGARPRWVKKAFACVYSNQTELAL